MDDVSKTIRNNQIQIGVVIVLISFLLKILYSSLKYVDSLSNKKDISIPIELGMQKRILETDMIINYSHKYDTMIMYAKLHRIPPTNFEITNFYYNFTFLELDDAGVVSNKTHINQKSEFMFNPNNPVSSSCLILLHRLNPSNYSKFKISMNFNPSLITEIHFHIFLYDTAFRNFGTVFRCVFFTSSCLCLLLFKKFSIYNKFLNLTIILATLPFPSLSYTQVNRIMLCVLICYFRFDTCRYSFSFLYHNIPPLCFLAFGMLFSLFAFLDFFYFDSGEHLLVPFSSGMLGDDAIMMKIYHLLNILFVLMIISVSILGLYLQYDSIYLYKFSMFCFYALCTIFNSIMNMNDFTFRRFKFNPIQLDFLYTCSILLSTTLSLYITKIESESSNDPISRFRILRHFKRCLHLITML